MSLINDMLRDLDKTHRRIAGGQCFAERKRDQESPDAGASVLERSSINRVPAGALVLLFVGVVPGSLAHLTPFAGSEMSIGQEVSSDIQQAQAVLPFGRAEIVVPTGIAPAVRTLSSSDMELPSAESLTSIMESRTARPFQNRPSDSSDVVVPQTRTQSIPKAARSVPVQTGHIEIVRRPLTHSQQLSHDFLEATDAFRNTQYQTAERLLSGILERDRAQYNARLLLAKVHEVQDRHELAERVLHQALVDDPQNAAVARSHALRLARRGQDGEAISVLESALPNATDDAEFHALLGGLYQRTGDASAADTRYRLALELEPTRGDWWVGLGISSEQIGDGEMARQAYRNAFQYPLTGELEAFAEQRINDLEAEDKASVTRHNQ